MKMPFNQAGYDNGKVIGGRYRILGLIGQGGMGEVYAAEDLRLQGKLRALKVNKANTADAMYSAEEAGLLMRLNHPHLPLIIDYFPACEFGHEILVMDYIDGITLQAHLMESGGSLSLKAVIEIGVQLCDALGYLHGQQPPIIHRDLKPTNVMMDRSGFVRLIDFGIARSFKQGKDQDTQILGTPGFAAPEQAGQQQSDARTDVYGLGSLLYFLLSGGNRFTGTAMQSSRFLSHLPVQLKNALARMLDPVPEHRYSSMEAAKTALIRCLGQELHSQHPISPRPNKQVRITVASLSPGSGSTFAAITLAHLLGLRGVDCAAVEHPELEPEWHALLNITDQSSFAGGSSPLDSRYMRRTASSYPVTWHALRPEVPVERSENKLQYRLMMDSLQQSVVVTDLSSAWMAKPMEAELLQADMLLFVVDPFPSKWTPERMKAALSLIYEREKHHRATFWAANKDLRFQSRTE
ncbi:serine/threonine protein kinase [Paenibacillus solisilvae]|uniref:Serine/threonine protein kinase n=1 Tax=Paenibacillus solisilvae TaxID=2486751 RepID=A0ABW0VS91_9BACL